MSRHWILVTAIAMLMAESLFSSGARADGGEALLERLLENQPAVAQQTDTAKPATATKTTSSPTTTSAAAARTTPRDAIRLTPDRTEIVRLEKDAASVVVTNPAHAQVMLETPRLILVMPRQPGSTSLFVLDKDGNSILERDIIVSAASKPYVRIRKSCNGNDSGCNADSYFYCPDGCYAVGTVEPSDTIPQVAPPASPLVIDTVPVPGEVPQQAQDPNAPPAMPEDIPPNAQSRTEAEPLPVMDDASGLDESELDTPLPSGEEEPQQ